MNIGIVNDMPMAVAALQRVIARTPEHHVVWTAHNGEEAVAQCRRLTPDLVLMDLFMPVMDGVEATRRIMAQSPCAVLVVTATVDGESAKVYEALGAGALDAVTTPVLGLGDVTSGASALREKIAMVGMLIGPSPARAKIASSIHAGSAQPVHSSPLVAIGASAGGPAALVELLQGLPRPFSSPVVIVQHVDVQFAGGMAEWLNASSAIPVRVARNGDTPEPGIALLAATNDHLVFAKGGVLRYVREPVSAVYRPSVDVMFQSMLEHWNGSAIAILLTGMGRDGAVGLKALREAGALTIAQDAGTSTVYGMPKAAAELGAAQDILPLHAIAGRVTDILMRSQALPSLRHAHV